MKCRDATDFLADYVGGTLTSPVHESFDAATSACERSQLAGRLAAISRDHSGSDASRATTSSVAAASARKISSRQFSRPYAARNPTQHSQVRVHLYPADYRCRLAAICRSASSCRARAATSPIRLETRGKFTTPEHDGARRQPGNREHRSSFLEPSRSMRHPVGRSPGWNTTNAATYARPNMYAN